MNTEKRNYYEIIDGPSKDVLFDACKYACDKSVEFPIGFKIVAGYTMSREDSGCAYVAMPVSSMKVYEIRHEDGSGESFILRGYCKAGLIYHRPQKFEAYYNTKKHKGWINLT